ncbi:MAG: alpha/beta hydrolase [Alphaproteobacteria bacterium]
MGEPAYLHYDQQALDAQYNNRARVPEAAEHLVFYESESARVREALSCHLKVPYGESEPERLDVFLPAGAEPAPVQVFFHGGYWHLLDSFDFSFVASPIVAAGGLAVIVNYALLPGVTMEELLRQCRASIRWVREHIGEYGGDPERICISGHSAGGHITAMMLADPETAGSVRGGVAISGLYDLEAIRLCYLNDVLRLTADQARRHSPIHAPPARDRAVVVVYGGRESEEFERQSETYADAIMGSGHRCALTRLPEHDHFTIVRVLAEREGDTTGLLLSQMGLV